MTEEPSEKYCKEIEQFLTLANYAMIYGEG
jgi:hypothetical protein